MEPLSASADNKSDVVSLVQRLKAGNLTKDEVLPELLNSRCHMSPCLRVSWCSNPTANCCSSSTNSQSFSRAVGPRLPRRPRSQSSRSMHRKTPSPCAERILLRPAFPLSLGRFERACVNNRCPRTILCIEASDQQWRRRIKDPSQRSNSWCAWACRLPSCAAALSLDPRVQTKTSHAVAA